MKPFLIPELLEESNQFKNQWQRLMKITENSEFGGRSPEINMLLEGFNNKIALKNR